MLETLVEQGIFQHVTREIIAWLDAVAHSQEVLKLYEAHAGLVHGDLRAENIFVLPVEKPLKERLRLVDWQRPLLGPPAIDRASLVQSLKLDPVRYAGAGAVGMRDFLQVRWFTECAARWIPASSPTYDRTIASICERMPDLML